MAARSDVNKFFKKIESDVGFDDFNFSGGLVGKLIS